MVFMLRKVENYIHNSNYISWTILTITDGVRNGNIDNMFLNGISTIRSVSGKKK